MSQDILPALIGSPLPLVDDKNQDHLSKLGWTPIAFAPPNSGATAAVNTTELCPPQTSPHPLLHASEALLANSQKFFDQSVEEKKRWENRRKNPGEKEYIILQTLGDCPEILRESAKMYWDWMGKLLEDTLESIECSLIRSHGGSQDLYAVYLYASVHCLNLKNNDKSHRLLGHQRSCNQLSRLRRWRCPLKLP